MPGGNSPITIKDGGSFIVETDKNMVYGKSTNEIRPYLCYIDDRRYIMKVTVMKNGILQHEYKFSGAGECEIFIDLGDPVGQTTAD